MMNGMIWGTVAGAALLVAVAAGCDSSGALPTTHEPPPVNDATEQAKKGYWEALRAGNVPAVLDAHRRMIAVFEARPTDHELARLIGFNNIFLVAYDAVEPREEPALRTDALEYTELAVRLPNDPYMQLYNSAFWGGTLYTTGARRNDPAAAQQGRDLLEAVVQKIPAFGLLTRSVVMRQAARGSQDWAISLESIFRFYERCTGQRIDRAHPDLTPVLARPFADPDSTCGNWEHAPHNIQGSLLHLGDSLVKNDQPDAARPVYELIERTEGYQGWAFASLVEERLASDLAKRARLYDQGEPFEQPEVGADCLSCHQR
ncbi:hypothetical protein [Pendulispora albinea]|uniref:Uncharacterized protein n=1 Tax=Pendulispora albinea TaxID=2741071 RepID=A0ABZ2LTS7_9BACT